MARLPAFVPLWLGLVHVAAAQQVTVQQPVVQTFGASTTVSVPDRGAAFLGGVNSAASGRVTTGPRSGTALGLERTASSMSVGVYIHDLRAMDEALLQQAAGARDDSSPFARRLAERRAGAFAPPAPAAPAPVDHAAQARKFERLARDAEARGKPQIARLHWQMAAKHGSPLAADALQKLSAPPATYSASR